MCAASPCCREAFLRLQQRRRSSAEKAEVWKCVGVPLCEQFWWDTAVLAYLLLQWLLQVFSHSMNYQQLVARRCCSYCFCCNHLQANHSGPPGPYYIPAAQHLNTPAAAVAAAAAAAANGLLSPANRHGAAAVAGDGQQGLAAAGSGWGHWGVTNQNNTHASNQALSGPEGLGGSGFRDAAATAGGREGRGGLGQELITPLQVDPSIGFDQVCWLCTVCMMCSSSAQQQQQDCMLSPSLHKGQMPMRLH